MEFFAPQIVLKLISHNTCAGCIAAHLQVYGYRMSLWAEHLGTVEECFRRPESEECVQLVNQMADDNWASYVSPQMVDMKGHLMKYPVKVEQDGRVGPLPGQESFPDVGGKVLGTHSSLPNALTT